MGSVAIGVDFGSQCVKFAMVRKRGQRVEVERLVKIPRSTSDVAEVVASGLKKAGLRASGTVMGVSGRGAIIRYTMVPPVPAHRLKMIMDYEIGELAGKSSETVSSDYKVLNVPRDVSQDFTVMVAMSKDQYVRESMFQLESAGVPVATVLPTPLALYNAFLGIGEHGEGQTYLVVDIGATNIDIVIVNEKDLYFARSIGRGADDFTEALSEALAVGFPEAERIKIAEGTIANAEWASERQKKISDALSSAADRLYSTLNSSITFASGQLKLKNLKIDKVVLMGGGSNLPGLSEHLSSSFGIEVVAPDLHTSFEELGGSPGRLQIVEALPPSDISLASESMREFGIAIGLALSKIDQSFYSMDLMPAEEKKKRIFKERTVFMYAAGAILLVCLMVRLVAAWRDHAGSEDKEQKLENRLEEARERLFELRRINEENAQIKSAIQNMSRVTESGGFVTQLLFLTRRRDITPDEIKITEIELNESVSDEEETRPKPASVLLKGTVKSPTGMEMGIVRRFLNQLLATEVVKSGEIDASRTRMDKGRFNFEIEVSAGRLK